jgi:hypothetical protein
MLIHEAYHENLSLANSEIDTPDVFLLNRTCSDKAVAEFMVGYLKYFPVISKFLN